MNTLSLKLTTGVQGVQIKGDEHEVMKTLNHIQAASILLAGDLSDELRVQDKKTNDITIVPRPVAAKLIAQNAAYIVVTHLGSEATQ
jgi:hypothetical protein